MRLDEMDLALLKEAVRRYLPQAYPGGSLPEDVEARLHCLDSGTLMHALESECVEKETDAERGTVRYLIRIGSETYPHVKVGLERCSTTDNFVLTVDTHDRHFLLTSDMSVETRERFEAVQDANRRLKEQVEAEWTAAGLPTFRRFIEEGLAATR